MVNIDSVIDIVPIVFHSTVGLFYFNLIKKNGLIVVAHNQTLESSTLSKKEIILCQR